MPDSTVKEENGSGLRVRSEEADAADVGRQPAEPIGALESDQAGQAEARSVEPPARVRKAPQDQKFIWNENVKKWVPRASRLGQAAIKRQNQRRSASVKKAQAATKAEKLLRKAEQVLKNLEESPNVAEPQPPPPPLNTTWVPQNDEELLQAMRVKAEEDFFFFASVVCELGYNPKPNGPKITEDQKELCDWLQRTWATQKRFVLAPRDTLKSTVLEAYVLWRLYKNPDLRVLLYGEVHEQAQKRLAKIKRIIETCPTFRDVCGDWAGGSPWNENMITIKTRTTASIRECSIETAGLDVVVNARHFDLIVPDDLHSEKNSKTREMIDGVEEKINLLEPLLDKNGHMLFAGVFWTDGDAHTRLIEKGGPDVEVFLRSCFHEDGTARYPYQLPMESIQRKRRSMRKDLFACHYLLDPVPKEDAVFKEEMFTTVPKEALGELRVFLMVDQAGDPTSETEARRDSDFTGIVVVGVNSAQDLIILDAFHGVLDPTQAVEQAMVFVMRHRPHVIGVEKAGVGNMGFYLREELRRKGMFAVVEDVMPQGRSKFDRVYALEPLARRHKIYLANSAQGIPDLMNELIRFPKGKHDDMIDALAYVLDLLRSYGTPMDMGEEVPEWEKGLYKLNDSSRKYWAGVHRAEARKGQENWVNDFV